MFYGLLPEMNRDGDDDDYYFFKAHQHKFVGK